MYVDDTAASILYGYTQFGFTVLLNYIQLIVGNRLRDYSCLSKFVYGTTIASKILRHHRLWPLRRVSRPLKHS